MSENEQKQETAEVDPLRLQILELSDTDHKKSLISLEKQKTSLKIPAGSYKKMTWHIWKTTEMNFLEIKNSVIKTKNYGRSIRKNLKNEDF